MPVCQFKSQIALSCVSVSSSSEPQRTSAASDWDFFMCLTRWDAGDVRLPAHIEPFAFGYCCHLKRTLVSGGICASEVSCCVINSTPEGGLITKLYRRLFNFGVTSSGVHRVHVVYHLTEAEHFFWGNLQTEGFWKHVQQVLRGVIECPLSGPGAFGSRVHAV